MQKSSTDQTVELLDQLKIFESTYEIRLLATLLHASSPRAASELSKILDIPDSKVYPALNTLAELQLIRVDTQQRPKKYSLDQPEMVQEFLKKRMKHRYKQQLDRIDELGEIIRKIWQPEEYLLDNIAQLYRGDEVINEMARHIKLTKSGLFIFLSSNFTHYELLANYLVEVSHETFRLDLVVPSNHTDFITTIETQVRGKIRMRTSIWNQNSYIIRDQTVMMNIFHSDKDVALLTNDELMVKNVKSCWDDPDCCTTMDLVDLELPDNFTFNTIKLP